MVQPENREYGSLRLYCKQISAYSVIKQKAAEL